MLQSIAPDLRCEVVGKVLHIYDETTLHLPANALNFEFAYFEMPTDIHGLHSMLNARLSVEPFVKPDSHRLIQPGSGYTSFQTGEGFLKPEVFKKVTAREIVYRAASEQKLALSSCSQMPRRIFLQRRHGTMLRLTGHGLWVRLNIAAADLSYWIRTRRLLVLNDANGKQLHRAQ